MEDNTIEIQAEGKEQLPVHVVDKLLGGKSKVRVALVEHPVTHELASCVPYLDYARAFSYEPNAIQQMIQRSPWIKKDSVTNVMLATDGKYYKTLCIFEHAALGVFMKLQPKRCKDPDVAARIDALQEELIHILHDALKGYRTDHGGYQGKDGFLPRPGLSMDAISGLCKEADKYLRGKVSLRALSYFTGMPTEDLMEEMAASETVNSALAGTIIQYLNALSGIEVEKFEIKKGVTPEGNPYLDGTGPAYFKAFLFIQHQEKLPKFFNTPQGLSMVMHKETPALEYLGIRRTANAKQINGARFHRFEFLKQKES